MSRQDGVQLAILALMKAVSVLDSPATKRRLVDGIGRFFSRRRSARVRRQRQEQALARVFGEAMGEDRMREVVDGTFVEEWREVFSLLPTRGEREALKGATVHGLEHVRESMERGKGAILWETTSFGRRLLVPQILSANGYGIVQVHGANHTGTMSQTTPTWVGSRLVFGFYERCEQMFVRDVLYLEATNSLAFTRTLRWLLDRNAILCVAADGGWGQVRIELDLLGCSRQLSTGMLSLARATGAPLLPVFCVSGSDGEPELYIEPPVVVESGADRQEALAAAGARYFDLWEGYIRRFPEHFRGWHHLPGHDLQRERDAP